MDKSNRFVRILLLFFLVIENFMMMDIASYIGEELRRGNRVYVINDVEQCAMCYDPRRPLWVEVKSRGGRVEKMDPRGVWVFDATVKGEVVMEEDFLRF